MSENTFVEGAPKDKSVHNVLDDPKGRALDRRLRFSVAFAMIVVFVLGNLFVFLLIYETIEIEKDLINLGKMTGSERVIDGNVFMALIAGTITQLGVLFATVVKDLFKSK